MKLWYLATEAEVLAFFDVDIEQGLNEKNVLARLEKFGPNTTDTQSIYKVWVKRQGRSERVALGHIVPGDVVLLGPGDRVPADIRLLRVDNLQIDQSSLIGNSLLAVKNTFALHQEAALTDQKCMAFAGTFVSSGKGLGVVVAHGNKVALGSAAKKHLDKPGWLNNLAIKKLRRYGVITDNALVIKQLHSIDMVFVEAETPDTDISNIIRKVQLSHGLPCKFLVTKKTADRLKKEYTGSLVYDGKQISRHVPKQFLGMINDCQFISDASAADMLKITSKLRQNGTKIMWITDGKQPSLAMQAAAVSLVVGDGSRDDVLARADLISPNSNATILTRILYNKN